MYRSLYLRPDVTSPVVDMITGPWYVVHGSFTFGSLLLGTCILLWYWQRTKATYWKQIVTLIASLVIPMVASFLYLIGLSPYGMDPVPMVMCFTNALYFWGIFSSKLFVLAPIARERIFESMQDGVLVIDISNRLVDYNQAAEQMNPTLTPAAIGKEINLILNEYTYQGMQDQEFESEWFNPKNDKYYHIRFTPIYKNQKIFVGTIIVIRDTTKQKKLEEQLKHLAYFDGLTNIYNRSYFLDKSSEQLKNAIQTRAPLSFILFDIDYFKKINDHYGHLIGDAAIRHVVSICKKELEHESIFGRYGGEEFVVCLPGKTISDAAKIAEKIRAAIELTPLNTEQELIFVTASFGVSDLNP